MNRFVFFSLIIMIIVLDSCSKGYEENPDGITIEIDLETQSAIPQLFAENIISTHMNERDIAISPQGDEIVYTLGNFNGSRRALVHLKRLQEGWSEPDILKFSGKYQDIEPFFHPGGNKLFFASTRPIAGDSLRSDYNIWYVERSDQGYGEPQELGDKINSPGDEFYPSVSSNGNLYFTASYDNGIGREDIFISRLVNGNYQAPQPLDTAINSTTYEFNAFISPNEDLIIFSSYGRADDLGGGDLYLSEKDAGGNWNSSRHLGSPINSKSLDYCPFVDFDRNSFYFTSNRIVGKSIITYSIEDLKKEYGEVLNGLGNIYRIKLDDLQLK